MNAPPSCRTCVRFRKCMEALRYYPCIEYKRVEMRKREGKQNERNESKINIYRGSIGKCTD